MIHHTGPLNQKTESKMDLSAVVLRYNPERWAEMEIQMDRDMADSYSNEGSRTPTKMVTFSYTKPGAQTQAQTGRPVVPAPRKRHLLPLLATSFERPVSDSIHNLAQYSHIMKQGNIPVAEADENWYQDLTNVGQRLKFLRDTFKVIQSVRKRKMMGERADFRTLYDAKVSRTGSPNLLDDDTRTNALSEDEELGLNRVSTAASGDASTAMAMSMSMSRRGRPRKRRGRERKNPFGRAEMAAAAANAKRTRVSRRILESTTAPGPLLLLPGQSQETTPAPPATRRRGGRRKAVYSDANANADADADADAEVVAAKSPELPSAEPQGPPLMHLPPILPSQRLSLVQGIPPYRHLPGYTPPAVQPKPAPPVMKKENSPQPYLPSQSSFLGPLGHTGGYLPSQLLLLGVVPFQFQPYTSPSPVPPVGLVPPRAQMASLKPALRPAFSGSYAAPINYANYTPASYSTGTNQSFLHKQSGDSNKKPGPAPKSVNLMTTNSSAPAIKPVSTLGHMAPLGSGALRALSYPRLAPLVATPVPRFNTWQLSYPETGPTTNNQRNIVLPKIQSLEKEVKPWSANYKAPGPADRHM